MRLLEIDAAIVAREGWWHVDGVYYANEFDAERQRRWYAARLLLAMQRRNLTLDQAFAESERRHTRRAA